MLLRSVPRPSGFIDPCKHIAYTLAATLLASSAYAGPVLPREGATCLKLHYKNSPLVIVSGRITTHHKLPKDSEQRTGDGPWLILDQPLLADHTGVTPRESPSYVFCYKWRKIAILPGGDGKEAEAQITQIKKWNNQHVTIDGELDRFESAMVSPSVYIRITTIKKD